MSDFGEVADALLLLVETALAPTAVRLHRGYKSPGDVHIGDTEPVFAMVYNPEEESDELEDAQFDRLVRYQLVLMRANERTSEDSGTGIERSPAFDQMSADLDAVRDQLQQQWPPDPGPLGGLVDTTGAAARGVDEVSDEGKVFGVMTVATTDITRSP